MWQVKKDALQDPTQQEPGTVAVGFWPCWAEALSSSGSAQHLIAQAFADLSVEGSKEPWSPGTGAVVPQTIAAGPVVCLTAGQHILSCKHALVQLSVTDRAPGKCQ